VVGTLLMNVAEYGTDLCSSYNRINGTFACENDRILNEVLKGELGFQGL
jgi:hypothetical protein